MKNNTLILGAALSVAAAAAIFGLIDRSEAASLSTTASSSNQSSEVAPGRKMTPLTDEEKAARQAEMEAHRAEMETTREAAQAAIEANDYQAWIKAVGENCPWADKITADNFSQFVNAYNLRQQSDQILSDLGIDKGLGAGFGLGFDGDRGQGHGPEGEGGPHSWQKSSDTSTTGETK